MAKAEKPKPIDYDILIDDLIQKIDSDKSLFRPRDIFHGYGSTLYFIGLFIFFTYVINLFPDSIASTVQKITLNIAIIALLITYLSVVTRGKENNVVDANFGKVIKKLKIGKEEKEKRILLEALLQIKAIAPSYELEIVKKMHPEMFTKEKLLEKLYE
jgi:retron-type reverse transcriptase